MCRGFSSGAAQESNLPSRGLHDLTGFEDLPCWVLRTGEVTLQGLEPGAGVPRADARSGREEDRLIRSAGALRSCELEAAVRPPPCYIY